MRAELTCLMGTLTLAGCAVGPKYHPPSAPVPATYKEAPVDPSQAREWKEASPQDAIDRGTWWEMLNDPDLNALQTQLDSHNQTIAQAYQNYMAARALVHQSRAQRFPTVATSPGVSRARASATGAVSGTAADSSVITSGSTRSDWLLPVDASWEPDLWGRIRNTVNQFRYAAQVSAADLENVRLSEQ